MATLFERGGFSGTDTLIVHATLAAYAIGLLGASCAKLFASGFHAMLDTRTPVRYAAVALGLGAACGAGLMWPLYAPGLALGGAVGAWTNLVLLWRGLGQRLGALFGSADLVHALKLLAGCGVGAAGALLTEALLAPGPPSGAALLTRVYVTAGTLAVFGVLYLAVGWALGALPAGGFRLFMRRAS